ncbi:MAG: 16S rRNA (guanine(527)-N(7))-methyltransferase RsmG [Acidobacteria bacterium]|nr:16S rRNA (guanine(527)-N(7))-methyltransferase RsmG [Acidobacteriota bacterium]
MTSERIAQLLVPFLGTARLSDHQIALVARYLSVLLRWNSKINLTAVREPEQIITRHFGESLFAARHLLPDLERVRSAIDLGSGAGFPGLALKIWSPGLVVTLIDASHKKAAFLRETIRALNFSEATVMALRAEDVSARADLVTLRAVEQFERMLPCLPNLLNRSGQLGLLVGESQVVRARNSLNQVCWSDPMPIPQSHRRVLLIGHGNGLPQA